MLFAGNSYSVVEERATQHSILVAQRILYMLQEQRGYPWANIREIFSWVFYYNLDRKLKFG